MILFYYIDKAHKNYIGNEKLIFDADNKKLILNNKDWQFMVLSDSIDSSGSTTAASLTALQNLKSYIAANYLLKGEGGGSGEIDSSIIDNINSSIVYLKDLLGVSNRLDKVINSYKEVENFLVSVSDSSTLMSLLTNMENRISKHIDTSINDLIKDTSLKIYNVSTDILDVSVRLNDLSTNANTKINILMDKLDTDAYYLPHFTRNTFTANLSVETGTLLTNSYFTATPGTAKYGYPEQTKNWDFLEPSVPTYYAVLGNNSNVASCEFHLTFNDEYPVLKTNFENTQDKVTINSDELETINANITGYYNWGWYISNSKSNLVSLTYNKEIMYDNLNNTTVNITEESQFVYIALPTSMTLTSFKVKSPVGEAYTEVDNFSMISSNLSISTLSTINKYNLWCCAKSLDNADGTVTPNSLTIKITTQIS